MYVFPSYIFGHLCQSLSNTRFIISFSIIDFFNQSSCPCVCQLFRHTRVACSASAGPFVSLISGPRSDGPTDGIPMTRRKKRNFTEEVSEGMTYIYASHLKKIRYISVLPCIPIFASTFSGYVAPRPSRFCCATSPPQSSSSALSSSSFHPPNLLCLSAWSLCACLSCPLPPTIP